MDDLSEGTAAIELTEDATEAPASEHTESPEVSATQRPETPAPKEESFIDVANLPEELKPHWKRMHGAYTKTREELKQGREALAQVQRFYQDPAYRNQVLQQLGVQPGTQQAQAQAQAPASQGGAPSELVSRVKSKLPPELQWMAQSLADTQWETTQAMMAPLQQKEAQRERQSKDTAFEDAASQMDAKHPGWEQHEQEMDTVLEWLQKGDLSHRKYGNRLEALYQLTQLLNGNDGFAVAKAQTRMAQAGRNRTSTGQVGRSTDVNLHDKIRGAKNNHEAIQLAVKQAEAEMEKMGIALRD